RPENTDRILALIEKKPDSREPALNALLTISGFDQRIEDPNEESTDRKWEEKQHKRHPPVLARLLERCFNLRDARQLQRLVAAARWARSGEADPVLALLVNHSDDRLRQSAVEAIGWRLRKRGGPAEPLQKTLSHKDPTTQFLAAEGLALGRRSEGINVLLSAVDFLSDINLRRRAVLALGELGDARALDTLLKIANEDGHVVQEAAAEALGHLGRSPKGEDIYRLLERYARRNDRVADNAIKGLRWLNTHAAWQRIRKRLEDQRFSWRETAAGMLGYNDDPATRDLLLRTLATDEDWDVVAAAHKSARRLWGTDSLEPDYALLQNP